MDAHAGAQFAEQVFLGGARHDLTNREILPVGMFAVEKRCRQEDFVGDLDIDARRS
jgi:hypothetical protein